jgi:hypothetical protein
MSSIVTGAENVSSNAASDPTGGVLAPIVQPIIYVISKMQDEVVSEISLAMSELKRVLMQAVNEVNTEVDAGFNDLTQGIESALNTVTTQILGIMSDVKIGAQDSMNVAEGILSDMQNIAATGLGAATQFVIEIYKDVSQASSGLMSKLSGPAIASMNKQAMDTCARVLAEITAAVDKSINEIANTVDNAIVDGAADLDSFLASSLREIRTIGEDAKTDAGNLLASARTTMQNTASDAALIAKREYATLETYEQDSVKLAGSIEKAVGSVENSTTLMLMIAGVFIGVCVIIAFKLHAFLIRPLIK